MTILWLLHPAPEETPPPLSSEWTADVMEVYVRVAGVLYPLNRALVTSVTLALNTDQTAALEVFTDSPNFDQIVHDGAILKGPYSPDVLIFATFQYGDTDLVTERVCVFEGFIDSGQFKPGTGSISLRCTGATGHKAVLSGERVNLLPPLSSIGTDPSTHWVPVNAHHESWASTGVPDAQGIWCGDDPDNYWRFLYTEVTLGVGVKPGRLLGAGWTLIPSAALGDLAGVHGAIDTLRPGQGIQWTLVNLTTNHYSSQFTDLSAVPFDVWTRVGTTTTYILAGHNYQLRVAVWAPSSGYGVIGYADVEAFLDAEVGVPNGATTVQAAAVMWQEQFASSNIGWSVLSDPSEGTVLPAGQWWPLRERSDPRSNLSSLTDVEWLPDPHNKQVQVSITGGIGDIISKFSAGYPATDLTVNQADTGSDGLYSTMYYQGPWGDECNEERVTEGTEDPTTGAPVLHPWRGVEQAPTGTQPGSLAALSNAAWHIVARGKSTAYTSTPEKPLGGRAPADWWPLLQPGSRVRNVVEDGPIVFGDTQRITGLELQPQKGGLVVTVASEAA